MTFEKRQLLRKAKRKLHQKRSAHLMRALGGATSTKWQDHVYAIQAKIRKREGVKLTTETSQDIRFPWGVPIQ